MELSCLIPANPDIAGIGIRASLYTQSLLVIAPAVLACFAPKTQARVKNKLSEDLSFNVVSALITGTALLIAAFAQARLSNGLSLYHGLLLFNLSWLNVQTLFLALDGLMDSKAPPFAGNMFDFIRRAWKGGFALLVYLSALGAYGIWLSSGISDFGSSPECNPSVVWVVFGRSITATSPPLRAFILAVSCMAAFPVVNLLLFATVEMCIWAVIIAVVSILYTIFLAPCCGFGLFEWLFTPDLEPPPPRFWQRFATPQEDGPADGVLAAMLQMAPAIVIIVGTEQVITRNSRIIEPGEDEWTFGQILALLLLALPLWQMSTRVWIEFGNERKPSTETAVEGEGEELMNRRRVELDPSGLERGDGQAANGESVVATKETGPLPSTTPAQEESAPQGNGTELHLSVRRHSF